ncbi:MAG: PhzF family phenazine biosynthesis protein [Methylococcales bacterium]|nr:PhzF family phenazine biosynthesis protein [Methylococcales bacterium]
MKDYNYYIADVFTKTIFSGAQIAVFPNAEGLNKTQMQLIAKELNLSQTVFVFHPHKKSTTRVLHIFSPHAEVKSAGHPVIAAAFVLASCDELMLNQAITPIFFEHNDSAVAVNITADEKGKPIFVQFSSKVTAVMDRFTPRDEDIASFLSLKVSELDHNKYAPRLVSCGLPYLVIPVWQYDSVRNARFNDAAWNQSIAPQTAAQEILLFSPKNPFADADFNVRLLGSRIGLQEDPPVGNAMGAFAAYLCSFDFMQKGTYTFAVDRGDERSRRSVLSLEMDNKQEESLTIRVGGEAVMVAEGVMSVPEL